MSVPINLVHVITMLELGGAQRATLVQVAKSRQPWNRRFLVAGVGGMLDGEARNLAGVTTLFEPALGRAIVLRQDAQALAHLTRTLLALKRSHPHERFLVHTHSSKAGILGRWAARLAGVERVVHTIHGFGHHPRRPGYWPLRGVEMLTARATDGFTADSEANLVRARAEGLLTARHRARVVRCGTDLAAYSRPNRLRGVVRSELGIPAAARVVLNLSCLKPQKAPLDYVRAAAWVLERRPESVFLLAGDGELRADVESLAQLLGIADRFRVLGWRQDVADLLHASDLLALTSLWEGLPQSFAQAMAAGLPIVATDVDGAREAIADGENGWLVPAGDWRLLGQRVLALLANPAQCQAMGEVGRRRAEPFSETQMLLDLDAFYAEVWAAGGTGAGQA